MLCVIDIYMKYACDILLKDKKDISVTNALQIILDESNRKPNKIWVDKGSQLYNGSMRSRLEKMIQEMYSTHNEGKSNIAEVFIRILKIKIYKYMTSF